MRPVPVRAAQYSRTAVGWQAGQIPRSLWSRIQYPTLDADEFELIENGRADSSRITDRLIQQNRPESDIAVTKGIVPTRVRRLKNPTRLR